MVRDTVTSVIPDLNVYARLLTHFKLECKNKKYSNTKKQPTQFTSRRSKNGFVILRFKKYRANIIVDVEEPTDLHCLQV